MGARFLSTAILLVLATRPSLAIPQNFNQGRGLFLGGDAAFENFATENATWAPGAKLPGEWSPANGTGAQTLKDAAIVFGLPAARISAERESDRINSLRVVFRESGKKSKAALLERVIQNIRAFTGETGTEAGKGVCIFRRGAVQIVARGISASEVVVVFTPIA
jgi:hypothetical protein